MPRGPHRVSKLYFRVYLHFVAIIVVFGAVVAIGWLRARS